MNHKLHEAMNEISDKHLLEAEIYQKRRFPYWIAAAAALLALVITLSAAFGGNPASPGASDPLLEDPRPSVHFPTTGNPTTLPITAPTFPTTPPTVPRPSGITPPDTLLFANLAAAPTYPKMVRYPQAKDFESFKDYMAATDAYRAAQKAQYNQPDGYADSLTNFFAASIAQFLQGEGNTAYSPLNVYMAMAMLVETTGGNSRQQILDLFGLDSIAQLREQTKHMWNAHYCADGQTSLLLGNSLWLDDAYSFKKETADLLASRYYASSFHGDLGTEEVNELLRSWLNEHTGGLLKDQAQNVKLDPATAFALASSIYFTAACYQNSKQSDSDR